MRIRSALCPLVAISLFAVSGGCPPQESGSNQPAPSEVSLTGLDTGSEGLSADVAEAMAAIAEPIPQDLGQITYMGQPLFAADETVAKVRARAATAACAGAGSVRLREVIRQMCAEAIELGRYTPGEIRYPAGDDPNLEPAQYGLAYTRGGKQIQSRTPPDPESVCRERLFGLDCSGYTKLVFAAGGINVPHGTWKQNRPEEWDETAIPADLSLRPVWIPGVPNQFLTGDLAVFDQHNGLVVEYGLAVFVWNCSGSKNFPCEKNRGPDYGPNAWPMFQILDGKKLPLLGVIRMVPTCAADRMVGGGDTVENLIAESQALDARWRSEWEDLLADLLACRDESAPATCRQDRLRLFKSTACPLLAEQFCVLQRKVLFPPTAFGEQDVANELKVIEDLLTAQFFDGTSCGCQ
ncbi:MAG: hypothetical protein HZB38_10345 [Planctomycetes bacterium]|nr:hypothetical protein [Planctomycetota bacterium]